MVAMYVLCSMAGRAQGASAMSDLKWQLLGADPSEEVVITLGELAKLIHEVVDDNVRSWGDSGPGFLADQVELCALERVLKHRMQ